MRTPDDCLLDLGGGRPDRAALAAALGRAYAAEVAGVTVD
jgi:hypothetical protein